MSSKDTISVLGTIERHHVVCLRAAFLDRAETHWNKANLSDTGVAWFHAANLFEAMCTVSYRDGDKELASEMYCLYQTARGRERLTNKRPVITDRWPIVPEQHTNY